jgi:nucleotide-binding universal stress UspA family protein
MQNTENGLIVVGIDGSPEADEALRFALDEARLRGARLRVVTAWSFNYAEPAVAAIAELSGGALATLESARERVVGPDADGPEIELKAVEGSPAGVILAESGDADMIVVGSRGHGGFASLLLGSCSDQLVHHADVPVVVVRPSPRPRRTGTGTSTSTSVSR